MKFDIEEELKKLPNSPGVYIMHDKNDKIIYVGKAINLKRRVTSYFRKTNKTQRILNMVALIDHFEYIICSNEAEALVLECNIIKKNMPKYNVLLKDGKTYPYIKINVKADYPEVYFTRKVLNDGARYFGPYPNSGAASEVVKFIKEKFKIRQCKSFKYKDRPCMNYQIKKCLAPCMGYISKEDYKEKINQIIAILEGKTSDVKKDLEKGMKEASEKLDFEKAAQYRDELNALDALSQRQKVSNISENDIDVIGLARNDDGSKICVQIFYIRNSKMVGRDNFFFNDMADEEDKDIISEFIKQYYTGRTSYPNKIMIRDDIEDRELLENWLTSNTTRKVTIKVPQKGEKVKLVEMAESNAKLTLTNLEKANNNLMLEMKQKLNLEKMPRRIEAYDISNISGEYQVASMVVMINGIIKKNMARRFKVKTVAGQDDPRSMEEVVTRRLRHSVRETQVDEKMLEKLADDIKSKYFDESGFGGLPDVILADGGITQIHAIEKAINNIRKESGAHLDIKVFGMVKNDKHQTRALMDNSRNEYEISEELFNLITRFQDEVHETAISYHKKLRNKSMTKSILDNIQGIGDVKKKELLNTFGSVEKIAEAKVEDLVKVKGITKDLAKVILDTLNKGE
jgi:excinuclease ABC subunit C